MLAVRGYDPRTDAAFVEASWARGAHGAKAARRIPPASWTAMQRGHMRRCLEGGTTLVAFDPRDASTLLGWVCAGRRRIGSVSGGTGIAVHWIYVPRLLRRQGLGAELLQLVAAEVGCVHPAFVVQTQASKHDGWIAKAVKRRGYELVFDPSLVPASRAA